MVYIPLRDVLSFSKETAFLTVLDELSVRESKIVAIQKTEKLKDEYVETFEY